MRMLLYFCEFAQMDAREWPAINNNRHHIHEYIQKPLNQSIQKHTSIKWCFAHVLAKTAVLRNTLSKKSKSKARFTTGRRTNYSFVILFMRNRQIQFFKVKISEIPELSLRFYIFIVDVARCS